MATFTGTTQKCKACEKTVYLVDQLATDGKVYHRACFRCHHCKSTLKLHNYSSFEGVLYCKPHFDQLFKMTGSLDKSFEAAPRTSRAERSSDYPTQTSTKVSSLFGGTQEKCVSCKKTVYPIEKVAVDGTSYHKACFRCTHGGCVISPSNYVAHEQRLYCRHHHSQLFKQKGDFSKLDNSQQAVKANGDRANGGGANGNINEEINGHVSGDNGDENGADNGSVHVADNGSVHGADNGSFHGADGSGVTENTV